MVNTHMITGLLVAAGICLAIEQNLILKILGGLVILSGLILGVMKDVEFERLKKESKKDGTK